MKNKKAKIIFAGCIAALASLPKENYPHVDLFLGPREFDRLALFLGLDRFIVPYVRGRERSRPLTEIIEEIKKIDKKKYSEVILLGQNINAYAEELPRLLEEVSKIEGIKTIRFLTSHPLLETVYFPLVRDQFDGSGKPKKPAFEKQVNGLLKSLAAHAEALRSARK